MDLTDKVVIVTGSGEGIGRASALRFAAAGSTVIVADIDEGKGQQTVQLIRTGGGTSEFVQTDVTVEAQVRAMADFTVEMFGRIDCAHNNAGGPGQVPHRPIDETDELVWDSIVDLNLKGIFLSMKHELRHMLEAGGGVIVNTASISGHRGSTSRPAYTAAKHGVVGLTKAAAMDYAKRGIRINAISPGVTLTDRFLAMRGEVGGNEFAAANMPIGRGANPVEVAEAAVWLCSDAASCITGSILAVDGGMSAL
jgi:NAD(P)-dependent dehydrogenase (short-subunit alcohol dehydrogenase family)